MNIACYTSSHTIMASSVPLGLNSHTLHLKFSLKTSNPILNKTSKQIISDSRRPTISYSCALKPTSNPRGKFRVIECKYMKKPNGVGPDSENKKYKRRTIKSVELEENKERDGMAARINEDEEIPEVVLNRIIRRIGFCVVAPILTGFILFSFYDSLKSGLNLDVPTWVPILTLFFTFGTSTLGLMYGAVSASWEPEQEGSLLGWSEALNNWPQIWKSDQGQPTD